MAESSSTSHSVYRIDPLHGAEDYSVWKIKMLDILTDLGLEDYIGDTPPSDTTKDWKALSTIRLRVDNGPLVHISHAKKAQDAWKTLQNLYEAAGAIGVVSARRKLFRAQYDEGGNNR
ncbi:hypothetical protein K435DRAFT_897844 [Dendrothele bispora CBS 962.96]|uniref:DUF4219 domain-containing protein n=1 Tax=Dendrothele bispora (strain CBS 962.96) TaxID=1314807 RepID=A0A4S8LZK4_DENBC|nr:hypothetical protein K435DRAFT_897844 [Dendrothele bispora CBS 962.96]